jgi:hypothetical protein
MSDPRITHRRAGGLVGAAGIAIVSIGAFLAAAQGGGVARER